MIRHIYSLALGALIATSCGDNPAEEAPSSSDEAMTSMEQNTPPALPAFEIQGHRGIRGLLPENTVPGFVLSIREGSDVLEMDLCISKDGAVIVSHEPWMSHEICTTPSGDPVAEKDERSHNLYQMTTAEIQSYDCGSRVHPRFPDQRPLPMHKPTLSDVVSVTETVPLLQGKNKVRYNLEIKHTAALESEFCPDADTFARIVLAEVNRLGIQNRTCIQSFSAAALEAVHEQAPEMTTAWLIASEGDVASQLAKLTFTPDIYSPNWTLLDAQNVRELQEMDIRVIPWTVNEQEDLYAVMQLGVDGIITDFPDRLYDMRTPR